jgi:hypothetical protein
MKKIILKSLALTLILSSTGFDILAQTRIRFARGRTSATVSGRIFYGERSFVLGARYGQYLSANVSSRNGCVKFSNGATSTNYITRSGNNYLYLVNGCGTTVYSLTVSINYGSD